VTNQNTGIASSGWKYNEKASKTPDKVVKVVIKHPDYSSCHKVTIESIQEEAEDYTPDEMSRYAGALLLEYERVCITREAGDVTKDQRQAQRRLADSWCTSASTAAAFLPW